jgi:hypothetical protein
MIVKDMAYIMTSDGRETGGIFAELWGSGACAFSFFNSRVGTLAHGDFSRRQSSQFARERKSAGFQCAA